MLVRAHTHTHAPHLCQGGIHTLLSLISVWQIIVIMLKKRFFKVLCPFLSLKTETVLAKGASYSNFFFLKLCFLLGQVDWKIYKNKGSTRSYGFIVLRGFMATVISVAFREMFF